MQVSRRVLGEADGPVTHGVGMDCRAPMAEAMALSDYFTHPDTIKGQIERRTDMASFLKDHHSDA
jgi:hypothetical protein